MYKVYNKLLSIGFDCVFSIFIVNNLNIFVWRIIWDTQDLYLKENIYLNSLISLFISYIFLFLVKYIQINEINAKFNRTITKQTSAAEASTVEKKKKENKLCKNFILKMFILMFSFANINHWRAVWNFTNHLTNNSIPGYFTIGLLSFLSLFALRRVCALMALPFQINKDSYQGAYQIQPTSAHHNYYLSLKNKYSNKVNRFFLIF